MLLGGMSVYMLPCTVQTHGMILSGKKKVFSESQTPFILFSNPKSKFRNPKFKLLCYYFKRNLNLHFFMQVDVSNIIANKFWFSFESNAAAIYFEAFFL